MANRRVLVKRRKAVRNIRKITRTMQLIATARFQAAFNRAVAGKPYTEHLSRLVRNLAKAAGQIEHPLLRRPEGVEKSALVTVTSSRGLCGAYNANVLRTATEWVDEKADAGGEVDLHVVGSKGVGFLRFQGRAMKQELTEFGDTPRYEDVEPLANELMDAYSRGEIGGVSVAYMKFVSTGKQLPVVEPLLPLTYGGAAEEDQEGPELEYEFSPAPEVLLGELLPAVFRVQLYQSFTDAAVSEQVARMVAMKAATDAAEDMIKRLTQQYNRARQTAITMELLDIVGGANALG